jgi:uncharacterized protein involved in outer membrane biogenesis
MNASATGSVEVDKLILGRLTCDRFSTDLQLQKGRVLLTKISSKVMGGGNAGMLKADFSVRPPTYSGSGTFDDISLAAAARLMNNPWVAGSASATYTFKASGWTIPDVLQSAELSAGFKVENGVFPHVVLAEGAEPLHTSIFSGSLLLKEASLSFQDAKLESDSGVYSVSGSASLAGEMNLTLTGETSNGYNLSGTFRETRVSPISYPATRADLKP